MSTFGVKIRPVSDMLVWVCWLAAYLCVCSGTPAPPDYESDAAVQLFREYIRIDTSHPHPDYSKAVAFITSQAASLGLPLRVYEYYPGKPILVITWTGTNASLPAIMLNSHMDVVAAEQSQWTYPPFEAHMDEDGNIFGRGTQDTKSVAICYLEAIRKLRQQNVTLARTIHITFVPDEEIGGMEGMQAFARSEDFENLNIGFALDEGQPSSNHTYAVLYGDKTPWQIVVNCTGESGHGSIMKDNSAGEKIRKVLNSFLGYREMARATIARDPNPSSVDAISKVTSINLTRLSGGIGVNVLPTSLAATFDMRLSPNTNQTEFNQTVSRWMSEAGCSYHYLRQENIAPATRLDSSNIYWVAFKSAADEMNLRLDPVVTPGATDMSFLRDRIPALGFDAISSVPILSHAANEYLPADTLLRGIDIYRTLIAAVADVRPPGLDLEPVWNTATSDMGALRRRDVPALGFNAQHGVRSRLHQADEYLPAALLVDAVKIYVKLIARLADAPADIS